MPMKLSRFRLVCLFFLLWAIAIAIRLFMLQVVDHSEYVEKAEKQQQRTIELAPHRGILYDRNLHELAMTVKVDSIYADPSEIDDKAAAARTLAAIVHTNDDDSRTTAKAILDRLEKGKAFAWIARRVSPDVSDKVHALNMKGIYYQKEFKRFYPNNQLAAQVLGYVGIDDNGLGGMELKFNKELHGTPGRMFTALDARRRVLGSVAHEPDPGENLQLTIDQNIQYMAEKALDEAMARTHADDGTVVVQDVHTGQILALAVRPTYNPNHFRYTSPELLRNHAIGDVYEPGSTFKLVTYSAALDQGVAKPDDPIDCQGGAITLFGRTIHDDRSDHYHVIPIHKALEVSSDVAAVKLALRMGPDTFYKYIRAFGFGRRSGIELPGETRGLLRAPKNWGTTSIGSIAIGQEVAVTPIQLVSMVSAIANGGTYLPPHILMPAPKDPDQLKPAPFHANEDMPDQLPAGAHRVISEMASAEMRKMMEGVVLYGTGKPAQLNGYSSAGKTGTAQKIDPVTHTYSKTMHIASFAGFAPVNNPVISIAVVIDNPKGASYYGTAVSAPVFAEVAQQVLEYLDVTHDIDVRPSKNLMAKNKIEPVKEDDAAEDQQDVNQLFAAVNDLPEDDPLRSPVLPSTVQAQESYVPPAVDDGKTASAASSGLDPQSARKPEGKSPVKVPTPVTVSSGPRLAVPSLVGLPMRKVIEQAAGAGLDVQVVGDGTAREQAPAAGTLVPRGTKIVVRLSR
ncbi:MAG TPA: penicillin-binding transpeptidase domain-containing protein [Terracidiphilus sp.]|nr:penicillin-binding transpeptidase domain-containing protein [Terracidiphilus sp.]